MNDEISRKLHEAAEAHQPDRGRMLARVRQGMAGSSVPAPRPGIARSWTRVTFAGLAAAGALATAGLAVATIVGSAPPPDTGTIPTVSSPNATTSSTPPARTSESPGAPVVPPVQGEPERTSTGTSTSAADPAPLSGKPVTDGPLSSMGFVDLHEHPNWAQSRLVLKTTQPLSAFSVELRIAQTGGVGTTGQWQTMAGDDFTVTVKETGGAVVYRWELKQGRTVPEGVHTFAAQYNHAPGRRDARPDTYVAQADAFTVRGGFTSQ
ncbi:hypothetical protein LFM09_00995 [Lentzea alba]|uniref:hypothetical protein n=1 Tax=Lentzea alba TaxID=2714351 RepID=UPI0039BF37AF